jgi:hemerythrin-like domain-containing protein
MLFQYKAARLRQENVMPVSIGAAPQAGFDQPLQLLQDCHRRIENFLEVLLRVVATATDDALDLQHRTALEAALQYFREAAPRHTQDEEESLFPRLRQESGSELHAALACISALESDHVHATDLHGQVDDRGKQWLRDGYLPASARTELRTWLEELRILYRNHIAIEDNQIFPLAGKILPSDILASVGREMRIRRMLPSTEDGRCHATSPR